VIEYQYYEFAAVDRPLDGRQLDELRALSTRAEITATSFVNGYHWGNFRGDPRIMMEKYFDGFLYLANWATHELMLRLPARLLDLDTRRGATARSTRSRPGRPGEMSFSMPPLRMRAASTTRVERGRSPRSCRSVPR
jgi:hypothetical protein